MQMALRYDDLCIRTNLSLHRHTHKQNYICFSGTLKRKILPIWSEAAYPVQLVKYKEKNK